MSSKKGSKLSPRTLSMALGTILVAASLGLSAVKLHRIDYQTELLVPVRVYDVRIVQRMEGDGQGVELSVFLPSTDGRQRVLTESASAPGFRFTQEMKDSNRIGVFSADAVEGPHTLELKARVRLEGVRYELPADAQLPVDTGLNEGDQRAAQLGPTDVIQSEAPEIMALAEELTPEDRSVEGFARNAFDYVSGFKFRPFKGTTSALTALRLREASCNGRSRLMVALFRARGIPARLVGGIQLTSGTKRTSHQWMEFLWGGYWIPIDALNGHFLEIPANYLTLYRGDEVLFRHTSGIAFDYAFDIDRDLVPRSSLSEGERLGLWGVFQAVGIPLELLRLLIMLPLGALVVVIFRNVVGFRTFGTFLPALIASSAAHTGLGLGLVGFVSVLLITAGVRALLTRLELLHSPQLAILLTLVIGCFLASAAGAFYLEIPALARVALFPVAVLSITAERFVLMQIEDGWRTTFLTTVRTLIVVAVSYWIMGSLSLQILMLAFPELLLAVVAIDLWIGRWVGLRLSEWMRFSPVDEAEEALA